MRIRIDIADAFAKAYAARISGEISKAKAAGQMVVDFHPSDLRIAALSDAENAVAAAFKKAQEAAAAEKANEESKAVAAEAKAATTSPAK